MERSPAIMTVDELARYLRVHAMTVYRLIQRGELPAVRVGRTWRFRKDQINQWLHGREINSNHDGDGDARSRPTLHRRTGRGRQ